MKFTKKQEKELKVIEWFVPGWCDWNSSHVEKFDNLIKIENIKEDENGMNSDEAFFFRSEQGKFPKTVKNKYRLRLLLWGKRWRERHLKEIWDKHDTFPQDFLGEPDYIREFVFTKFFNLQKDWKPI